MSERTIAVVGSGPAGCYVAQALRRALPHAEITVYERLAVPFGLVRYGVAADHQHTKAIQGQFERLFEREGVRFVGNVEVGADVTLDELRENNDAVVLATGLSRDRALGVPGDDLHNVHGAGRITRLFNAHPLEPSGFPVLGDAVAVIGGGNVSIDIVRLLTKRPEDFGQSDIDPVALAEYSATPVRRIELISRSSVENVRSDPAMLAELGRVPGVRFRCDDPLEVAADAPRAAQQRAAVLAELVSRAADEQPRIEVVLRFGWAPEAIDATDSGARVRLVSTAGVREDIEVDTVITAVGFDFDPGDFHGLGELTAAETGRVAAGLFRTGWIKRGSQGTIAENRQCAKAVAAEVVEEFGTALPPGRPGFFALPEVVRAKSVSYDGVRLIDARETANAPSGRVREKLRTHEEMLGAVRDGLSTSESDREAAVAKEER